MIKLVAYDWNGTLLADLTAVVEGVNKELEVINGPNITTEDYQRLYDSPTSKFFQKLGLTAEEVKANSRKMATAFHSYYEPRVVRARTRSGTKKTLSEIKRMGISQIILSNHTLEGIYSQLHRLKLESYFKTVLANDAIGKNHFGSKQERLATYLAEYGVSPKSTILIGDTVEETAIGKELGTRTVSITGGYNSTQRLRNAKPDYLINKVSELIKIVDELNKGA